MKRTNVANHASYFTEKDDQTLTKSSMTQGHVKQGITEGVYVKTTAIDHLLNDHKKDHTADEVATIYNPVLSGIWGVDGQFNIDKFNQLANKSINQNGLNIIIRLIVDEF